MTDTAVASESLFLREERFLDGTSIPVFHFEHLHAQPRLDHGVFTRRGGVSGPPCRSLNVGLHTSDRPSSVQTNLKRVQKVMGADRLLALEQVHGRKIVSVHRNEADRIREPIQADGLITDAPGLGLVIKQADCQAAILFDPDRRVVANVHCGWRGNVADILGTAVKRMREDFGCRPEGIRAGIGPSLGPCCGEFRGHEAYFPPPFQRFRIGPNHFDLWALSAHQLAAAGLAPSNVAVARICTRCRTDLFFSYRGEGDTGRFATVAMISRA